MTVVVRGLLRTISMAALCVACDRAPVDVLQTRVEVVPPGDAGPIDARVPEPDARVHDAMVDANLVPETLCDGIDNDGDGFVDNVDLAKDGICDCLRIATLGSTLYPMDDTFKAWLDAQAGGVTALGAQVLGSDSLKPFQVLIVQDVRERAYAADEVESLRAWVANGGGLFTLTGYTADSNANVDALLAPFGLRYGTSLVLVNPFANESLPVSTWYEHPVTRGISRIGVVSAYQVLGEGEVLAEGSDVLLGSVVVMRARDYERGHVLAWGDEWITYNSEWQSRPDYQVLRLWQNILEWLGPINRCQVLSY